ncbi:hypothetical protein B7P43_G12135 [Cryptotermes secundus]|uniref:Uncharacterized protein n=1 Tax=Cryptotermes secundus TaxID=105785 RepID=A0A2J7R2E7_9NEOP|nr:hypothetical protein B7P43_G12135 [Cryptotermes secundus]
MGHCYRNGTQHTKLIALETLISAYLPHTSVLVVMVEHISRPYPIWHKTVLEDCTMTNMVRNFGKEGLLL